MADTKITALTELAETPNDADLIPIIDVSDTTMSANGTNKKVTIENLRGSTIVPETAEFTLDPASSHPNGCIIILNDGAPFKLPTLVNQPATGYKIDIGGKGYVNLFANGSSTGGSSDASVFGHTSLIYLGSNIWTLSSAVITNYE